MFILKGDDDEEVRKIQLDTKVHSDDVGEPAIEIKLELPTRNSATEDEVEEVEEQEVIRIESIEVTTLDPDEVEELKVSPVSHATSSS